MCVKYGGKTCAFIKIVYSILIELSESMSQSNRRTNKLPINCKIIFVLRDNV